MSATENVFFQNDRTEFRLAAAAIDAVEQIRHRDIDAGLSIATVCSTVCGLFSRIKMMLYEGTVVRDDPMKTIVNAASRREQRNFTNAILFSALFVVGRLHDLVVPETNDQNQQCCNNYVPMKLMRQRSSSSSSRCCISPPVVIPE